MERILLLQYHIEIQYLKNPSTIYNNKNAFQVGCISSAAVAIRGVSQHALGSGVFCPGGVWPGVSAMGVFAGGCLPGGCLPQCMLGYTPPGQNS